MNLSCRQTSWSLMVSVSADLFLCSPGCCPPQRWQLYVLSGGPSTSWAARLPLVKRSWCSFQFPFVGFFSGFSTPLDRKACSNLQHVFLAHSRDRFVQHLADPLPLLRWMENQTLQPRRQRLGGGPRCPSGWNAGNELNMQKRCTTATRNHTMLKLWQKTGSLVPFSNGECHISIFREEKRVLETRRSQAVARGDRDKAWGSWCDKSCPGGGLSFECLIYDLVKVLKPEASGQMPVVNGASCPKPWCPTWAFDVDTGSAWTMQTFAEIEGHCRRGCWNVGTKCISRSQKKFTSLDIWCSKLQQSLFHKQTCSSKNLLNLGSSISRLWKALSKSTPDTCSEAIYTQSHRRRFPSKDRLWSQSKCLTSCGFLKCGGLDNAEQQMSWCIQMVSGVLRLFVFSVSRRLAGLTGQFYFALLQWLVLSTLVAGQKKL